MSNRQIVLVVVGLLVLASAAGFLWWYLTRPLNRDLVYRTIGETELTLDLDYPKEEKERYPVVVFLLPDGKWHRDFKDRDRRVRTAIESFTGGGYVVATVHFRTQSDCKFPGPLEDVKTAIRWLRAHAKKHRLDPDHIAAVGVSLGGYLACMLGATDSKDGFDGEGGHTDVSSRVQAVISFAAPTDVGNKTWPEWFEVTFLVPFIGASYKDKPELYRKASPFTYVSKDDPPFLFIHATKDPMIKVRHSRDLADKLQKEGVSAKVIEVEGEEHVWEEEKLQKTAAQCLAFLDQHLKK